MASASVSREDFLRNLADSGLFAADDLRKLLDALPPDAAALDGAGLAQRLVGLGKLTAYQAVAVLERQFGQLRIGRYDVLDRLGAGGMGTVYKACHRRMKRIVALKVLPAELAARESFVQRFQREVQTIARLIHPNIVVAFDADEAEVGHFLVMEFVNGRDLASEVQRGGPLSVADAVRCTLEAARGLAYAHAQGIIHRDIKPANLLREAGGVVKVADLGLARLNDRSGSEGSSLTQAGGILGTADFMPPEQAFEASVDQRADIYSLGCTLFLLLTGQPPYAAGSMMALLLKHREAPIPSPRDSRPDTPAELEAVYRRMVAKKPDERFANMDEVIRALEALEPAVRGLTQRPAERPASAAPAFDMTVAAETGQPQQTMAAQPPTADAPPPEVKRLADLTVVLVEPSRTQAGIIRKYLQQLGIDKVHSVGAGREAMPLARQTKAQVFLSAMHLSDMTGVQLGEAVHADSPGVGFVLTTSQSDVTETAQLCRSTRTVLLQKPFDLRQLAGALAQATGLPAE
jgi:CheY-like chemotaxis protein